MALGEFSEPPFPPCKWGGQSQKQSDGAVVGISVGAAHGAAHDLRTVFITNQQTTTGPQCAKHCDYKADQISLDNSIPRAGTVRSVVVWRSGPPDQAVLGWGKHGGPGSSERAPRGGRGQADFLEEGAPCFLRRKSHAA